MSNKDKAAPKKSGLAKEKMAKEARQQVKKRTDELLDDDEFGTDIDFDSEVLMPKPSGSGKLHTSARQKLEDYLEEKRLRNDLEDDFDY